MKTLRVILSLGIWLALSATIWFSGSLLFDYSVKQMQTQHAGVTLADFPWGKAYSSKERTTVLKSFAYVRRSLCTDSLIDNTKEVFDITKEEDFDVLLGLYDALILRAPTDTAGRFAILHYLSQAKNYKNITITELQS